MQMKKVESSNIDMIGWHDSVAISFGLSEKSILRIAFKNGRTYDYYDVPKDVFDKMLVSPSMGKFFHQNIMNKYDYELIKAVK